eukprot:2021119-Amphidinium_carterae.1
MLETLGLGRGGGRSSVSKKHAGQLATRVTTQQPPNMSIPKPIPVLQATIVHSCCLSIQHTGSHL